MRSQNEATSSTNLGLEVAILSCKGDAPSSYLLLHTPSPAGSANLISSTIPEYAKMRKESSEMMRLGLCMAFAAFCTSRTFPQKIYDVLTAAEDSRDTRLQISYMSRTTLTQPNSSLPSSLPNASQVSMHTSRAISFSSRHGAHTMKYPSSSSSFGSPPYSSNPTVTKR